jgi:hypothetical protein
MLASVPNAPEPAVAHTTVAIDGDEEPHRGRQRLQVVNEPRRVGDPGICQCCSSDRVLERHTVGRVVGEPAHRSDRQLARERDCGYGLQVATEHCRHHLRAPPSETVEELGTSLRDREDVDHPGVPVEQLCAEHVVGAVVGREQPEKGRVAGSDEAVQTRRSHNRLTTSPRGVTAGKKSRDVDLSRCRLHRRRLSPRR